MLAMRCHEPQPFRAMKTPKWVDVEITGRCNLGCPGCKDFSAAGDRGQDLPADEWLQFFEELNRCAVSGVTLSGGEPFVREDLEELLEGIADNRMRFSMCSNGTLVTDEIASMLAATGRCDSVLVSIDSSISTTRETFRAKGNFYKALQGARILQRRRVAVTVQFTVHRQNVHELEEITRLILDELRLPGVSWGSALHNGLCRKNTEQTILTTEERTLAMNTLLGLATKYGTRISAGTGPLAEARNWMFMAEATKKKIGPSEGRGFLTGCGGPAQSLAVRADGVMVPCIQLPHIYLGRINEDDLREVWQNHPELALLRRRNKIPLNSFESCTGCEYAQHCSGGCPANAHAQVGSADQPSSNDCLRKFLEEGGQLPAVQGHSESGQPKRRVAC